MIIGIGTDIIEIQRLEVILNRGEDFLHRHFSPAEQAYFSRWKSKAASVAAAFCGKEAVAKALGTGISGFSLVDIEILHEEKGKPYVLLHENAKKIAEAMGIQRIHLSLSHSQQYATAFCIAEGWEEKGAWQEEPSCKSPQE